MPVDSAGKIVKYKRAKGGTLHQKNHRWESFSTKISKLHSLNPIRKVRRNDIEVEDLSSTTSYLKNGLDKWSSLCLSKEFKAFYRVIAMMCDCLPQIIHFEDKIMDNFILFLEKREKESLEPLLELLADFAHDLGHRFEKHYARVLEHVTSIIQALQDVDVIEWGFTSLTFMFKYLSRLLAPDLRPTFDLMAPLLGKHCQRPHITRFTAESLSFLLRKSASPACKGTALNLILTHAKNDLLSMKDTKELSLYQYGLMTMFSEAIKGHGFNIHTTGTSIFRELIQIVDRIDLESGETSPWIKVIIGTLTSTLHHTNVDTFQSILEILDEKANGFGEIRTLDDLRQALLFTKMIGICMSVRKGSRIKSWAVLVKALSHIVQLISKSSITVAQESSDIYLWDSLILSIGVSIQYVPIDSITGSTSLLIGEITRPPLAKYFLTFCYYLSEAEPERFRSILIPYFQRFVVAHWSDIGNEDALCVLLPKLLSSGALPLLSSKDRFLLPQSWQDEIASKFKQLEASPFPEQKSLAKCGQNLTTCYERHLPKLNALLEVLECTVTHPSTNSRIAEILLRKLKLALRPSSSLASEEANFIVGRGFKAFLKMIDKKDEVDRSLRPLLHAAAPRYIRLPNFLSALMDYEINLKNLRHEETAQLPSETETLWDEALIGSLVQNLSTDSHDLRFLSLRLLDQMHIQSTSLNSDILSLMIRIEETPINFHTVRSISMLVRKLTTLYPGPPDQNWIKNAMTAFFFGLLTVKSTQIWEEATLSLKTIAETKKGEDFVLELAISWLETQSDKANTTQKKVEPSTAPTSNSFECSNLSKLVNLAKEAELSIINAKDTMQNKFLHSQKLVAPKPQIARSQALRILATIPTITEKYSRCFVPMFLSWSHELPDLSCQLEDGKEPVLSNWSRKDQKSQLELFSGFSNPKSLHRSADVYTALLSLLKNGDIEIQRSALKAIFAWKDQKIKPYEENLLNLLDEARFREELSHITNGTVFINPDHRSALMSILLRVLYGRSMSRKSKQGMEARRKAIFRALSIEDIQFFIDISLGDLMNLKLVRENRLYEDIIKQANLTPRKLVGLSFMIKTTLKELGLQVSPFTGKLLNATICCILNSSHQLRDDHTEPDDKNSSQVSLLKSACQNGIKCLALLFTYSPKFDWSPYLDIINKEIICPRLDNFSAELTQEVSTILRLFSIWSNHKSLAPFLSINCQIIPKITECLALTSSKPEVKIYVLGIVRSIAKIAREEEDDNDFNKKSFVEKLLNPNMNTFLNQIRCVLQNYQNLSRELLGSCVETASALAAFVNTPEQCRNMIEVSVLLLEQPSRFVSPKLKSELLHMLEHFLVIFQLHDDPELKERLYVTISSLFGYFKDRASRETLSRVLQVYSKTDNSLGNVASICVEINSFAEGLLDEPDYEKRIKAFNLISQQGFSLTARQWTPLLYNMLFYMNYDEEFGILSANSSDGICQLISVAKSTDKELEKCTFKQLFLKILMPAIYSGVRESSEVVRREYLKVTAHLVRNFPRWSETTDMHTLLIEDNEDEESFFNNILAPGKGRQSKALSQLTAAAEKGNLSSKNISQLFIPLVEHFIFSRTESDDAHSLAAEAVISVGALSASLRWPQYRATLKRLIGYIEQKPQYEKQIIRLLGRMIDSLDLASCIPPKKESDIETAQKNLGVLSATMPEQQKLTDDLTSCFLPPLMKYIQDKDEITVSLRVPVAIIVVKLLKLLPKEELNLKLPAVLTEVCHILRSKAQESRDMARDTLSKISILLGPSCFGSILKELRAALSRGSQLHVLSYTVHTLLVATTPMYKPGDLDYCISSLVAIIMDDIFGDTSHEKDAHDYVSKLKEVKSRKSHDSMELIVQSISLPRLKDLIRPIQALLQEKLTLRIVRKIDELLNRINSGLLKNTASATGDTLIFYHEIIHDVYNYESPQEKEKKENYRLRKYLIQKAANKSGERGSTASYSYKMVLFAFNLIRSMIKKHDHLRSAENLTHLVPIMGDAIVQAEEEVKIATFKLLTTISIVPLGVLKNSLNLYRVATNEAIKTILASSSTNTEISQVALKLLSVILRNYHEISIKETEIDKILLRIKDHMTQIDSRHVTFNFLRAVLDLKVQTAVLYDTLDYIGTVMVTNDDSQTRDLSRGAYFHFLRDFPQKKARWSKQLAFIVANLNYEREGGRLSILEVIHLLISKSAPDFVQEVSATTFVPLVLVLANDESEKCRMAAGELLRNIFNKVDNEKMRSFLSLLRSWIKKDQNASVKRLAFQAFGFFYESLNSNDSDLVLLLETLLETLRKAECKDSNWEEIYSALQLIPILVSKFPSSLLCSNQKKLWSLLPVCLSYPCVGVKLSASKIASIYFAHFARSNIESNFECLPLKGSYGLNLDSDQIVLFIRKILNMLKAPEMSQTLADEAVKNIVFLARIAGVNEVKFTQFPLVDEEENDGNYFNENEITNHKNKRKLEDKTLLHFIFGRLSYFLRRETIPPRFPALVPKISSLQILQHLISSLSASLITLHLSNILLPLSNFTDPNIPSPYSTDEAFRAGYENLKTTSEEILECLKKKVGVQAYSESLIKVREVVKEKRLARGFKRKVETVSMPEKSGEIRRKKLERKKGRRKERGSEHKRRRFEC